MTFSKASKLQSGEADLTSVQSDQLISKITWRILPLLFVCYIIAYIDRINVGFAKLQLREVMGVDETMFGWVYGLGAGLFFIGYFLFEIPSNLIMQRVGARFWIARIMIIWGIVSVAMMFIRSTSSFYIMRFLLGVAEAGFYPGVILYLTYWFPLKARARTIAFFATGGVIAGIIGSPLSGMILDLDGLVGLAGWQWLFLLEGVPAILMGLVVFLFLPGSPEKAKFLSANEKQWIKAKLEEENNSQEKKSHSHFSDVLLSRRVWLLCFIYFLLNVGGYGYEMWLPSIVQGFTGMSYSMVGIVNAIPYLMAAIAMLLVGRHSDKTGERRWYVAFAATSSAIGFAFSAYLNNPYLAMAALTLALVGLKSTMGPFWALSTAFLSGTAAAGGIALINSVGNLGGFAGPLLVGFIKDRTGDSRIALWFLGGALLLMGILILTVRSQTRDSR